MRPDPRVLVLAVAAESLGSCAATARVYPALSLSTPSSTGEVLDAVAERARSAPPRAVPPIAVLVATPPSEGFRVLDLPSGRPLGQVNTRLLGRPWALGDLVVARVEGAVAAWSLAGIERWRVPDEGLELVGADREGGRIAIVLGGGGVTRRRGVLLTLEAADGTVVSHRATDHALGAPAIVGDRVVLPWEGQNVSVLTLRGDDEIARLRSRDDVIGFARREGPAVYFGGRALYRLDARAATGTRVGSAAFVLRRDDLPGSAPLAHDVYTPARPGLDARERVRVIWRPDPAREGVALLHGAVFVLYHRLVFCLGADDGAVRWAWTHPRDIAGADVSNGGLTAVDDAGEVLVLDASNGATVWRANSGSTTVQAVLQLPIDFRAAGHGGGQRPLVEGLLEAAGGTDTRLLPAQRFAVRALGASEDPTACGALVAVMTRGDAPLELRNSAGDELVRRARPCDGLIEALEVRYDFVRGTRPNSVGILARAVAASGDRRAVPHLLNHLGDPGTPAADLPLVAAALRALGDRAAVPGLMEFLRQYHADTGAVVPVGGGEPIDERDPVEQQRIDAALEVVARALAEMGGPAEQRALDAVAAHPTTPGNVRQIISARPRPSADGGTLANDGGSDMTFAAPPTRLSPDAIADAFDVHRTTLLACLRDARSRPTQVRVQFRYDAQGTISQPLVLPAAFQACMAPVIERIRLPESGAHRELGTWYLDTR